MYTTVRNVHLAHMRSVEDIPKYYRTGDKEELNLSRGAGSRYDRFATSPSQTGAQIVNANEMFL
jgi:hypothetical protein